MCCHLLVSMITSAGGQFLRISPLKQRKTENVVRMDTITFVEVTQQQLGLKLLLGHIQFFHFQSFRAAVRMWKKTSLSSNQIQIAALQTQFKGPLCRIWWHLVVMLIMKRTPFSTCSSKPFHLFSRRSWWQLPHNLMHLFFFFVCLFIKVSYVRVVPRYYFFTFCCCCFQLNSYVLLCKYC